MLKKKTLLIIGCIAFAISLSAQKSKSKPPAEIKIPMTPERWEFPSGSVEFSNQNMTLSGAGKAVLKDFNFSDGTIEYDIEPFDDRFAGMYFRMADDNESEYFYLRVARAGNPTAMDAAQYAAYNKGVLLWDMLGYYQGPAEIRKNEKNHIKIVVSGLQMIVYVNDLNRATLEIPRLEGNTIAGKLAFDCKCSISNLVIKPDAVEGLSPNEGFDPTHHDPRYIRAWQVGEPQALPPGEELFDGKFPRSQATWKDITAERRGLINLTRLYGKSESRRYVWLRVKLISATEQKRKVSLGFSDEVWVFLNKQPLYVDKNIYTSPGMRKEPDGRISIENGEFDLPLRAGDNDLLIGVANDFYGWGLIARLDNMAGIQVSTNFPIPLVPPKDLSKYLGAYNATDASLKITIKEEDHQLMGQVPGQPAVMLDYSGQDKFVYEQEGVVLEFFPDEKKMILKQSGSEVTFLKE